MSTMGKAGVGESVATWRIAMATAVISVLFALAMAKYSAIENGTARRAAAVAIQERADAKAEVLTAKHDAKIAEIKAAQTMDKVIGSYELVSVEVPSAQAVAKTGFVYLGICDGQNWVASYFSNMPKCADGPLTKPTKIWALRDMKVRAVPPSESGIGTVISRVHVGHEFRLVGMVSIAPAIPHGPQVYWGEIELDGRSAGTSSPAKSGPTKRP